MHTLSTLRSGSAAISLDGSIGSQRRLTELVVGGGSVAQAGTTTVKGDLTASNTISLDGPVIMVGHRVITADEIDFGGTVSASGTSPGSLTLVPYTGGLDIHLGGSAQTAALDLTTADLNNIGSGFTSVVIGSATPTTTARGDVVVAIGSGSTATIDSNLTVYGENVAFMSGALATTSGKSSHD